jgi:hypothetical protein
MENFTIHIFGYGETQINSKDLSVKSKTTELTKAQPLVDDIWAKKPKDNTSLITDYHAINIFNYTEIRWISNDKNKKGFVVKVNEELKGLIDDLINELQIIKTNMLT